jgi:hypothetical protein
MKHISDHILEVYALNRHALSMKDQSEIYQHIGSCSECRKVLTYLCSIWKKDLHLVFEPIEVPDSEGKIAVGSQLERSSDPTKHQKSMGYYVTSSSKKQLRVSRTFSQPDWFINIVMDSELNDSFVIAKLSLVNEWIVLTGNQLSAIPGVFNFSSEDLLKSTALYKISHDVILPSDEFMIRIHQNTILIDTHRAELNSALLENSEASLTQHNSSSGIFEIPASLWTKTSRMHLFSV